MQTKTPVSNTVATSGWREKMGIPWPVAKRLGSVLLAVTGCCTKNLLVIALIASRKLQSPTVFMENTHLLANICQRLSEWQLILKSVAQTGNGDHCSTNQASHLLMQNFFNWMVSVPSFLFAPIWQIVADCLKKCWCLPCELWATTAICQWPKKYTVLYTSLQQI